MRIVKTKGIGTSAVVAIIVIIAIAGVGYYFVTKGGEAGLKTEDLRLEIGDEWQYRATTENGVVMLIDLEVKSLENVVIGERTYEAYLIEGSANVEDWGNLLPEGFSVVSSDVDVTMHEEKEGLFKDIIMDMALVVEYQGTTYSMKFKNVSASEVISGRQPDIIKVGESWSMTERKIENNTVIIDGTEGGENTELTSTVNYECTGTKSVSVQAGTFYCYEVRETEVGGEGYFLRYYSAKTKRPVKSVKYKNGQIASLWELVSYSV